MRQQSESTTYDLQAWGVSIFDRPLDSLWCSGDETLEDGIFHFTSDSAAVDIRLDGIDRLTSGGSVLVCFGGAVTSRAGVKSPFFSGLNIAQKLNLPLLAVADPSLDLSNELLLGWYAGHSGIVDLPLKLARLLDAFIARTGAKLILFGGSGGGFSAISVLHAMASDNASAVVWNPQTSIGKYVPEAVERYLVTAFPDLKSESLAERLGEAGIVHDLVPLSRQVARPVLYMQNRSDWHVRWHAKLFAAPIAAQHVGDSVYATSTPVVFWFGDWGEGHAPAPESAILLALGRVADGTSALDTAKELSLAHPSAEDFIL